MQKDYDKNFKNRNWISFIFANKARNLKYNLRLEIKRKLKALVWFLEA